MVKFGLPDGLTIKTPSKHSVFTVDGKAFAYSDDNKIHQSLLIAVVDIAGNASWKNADHHLLTEAIVNHLHDERRSNSDGHM